MSDERNFPELIVLDDDEPLAPAPMPFNSDIKRDFDQFERLLNNIITQYFLEANQYATKETLILRCFRKLCQDLNVDFHALIESTRGTFKIDQSVLDDINTCWTNRINRAAFNTDEQSLFERIMSKDYTRMADVVKFAGYLIKRGDKKLVDRIFAVDGYVGFDAIKYVNCLEFSESDCRGKHVRFVRKMHDVMSPNRIYEIFTIFFEWFENEQLVQELLNDETSSKLDTTERDILREYLKFIGFVNLERIVTWKRKQVEADNKASKQKLDNKSKKRKVADPEDSVPTATNDESDTVDS